MHLADEFLTSRKEHLLAKRDKVQTEVSKLEADLPQLTNQDRIIGTQHLIETKHSTLARIQAALDRLDIGTYGVCLICQKDIPTARLERMPDAPTCVTCSKKGD
jgi:DnaK suppressor protein